MVQKNNAEVDELVTFRSVHPTDLGFIISTWLKGLYFGNSWFRQIDQERFHDAYAKVIDTIIFLPDTRIELVCLKEDTDVIIGYSVENKKTLHWVWVRPQWRKLGLAKRLISSNINKVTHLTKMGKSLKPRNWMFDPFL